MTSTLDTLAMTEQHAHFAALETRLVQDYGDDARGAVHQAVEEERARFAHAKVHAFVPVLVERSVRHRLGDRPL